MTSNQDAPTELPGKRWKSNHEALQSLPIADPKLITWMIPSIFALIDRIFMFFESNVVVSVPVGIGLF